MSAHSEGRAAAAAGTRKDKNPYGGWFTNDRPGDDSPRAQKKYDEWNEGYEDKKREMKK